MSAESSTEPTTRQESTDDSQRSDESTLSASTVIETVKNAIALPMSQLLKQGKLYHDGKCNYKLLFAIVVKILVLLSSVSFFTVLMFVAKTISDKTIVYLNSTQPL